jgi:co-chaperonin GroES (HSP10)
METISIPLTELKPGSHRCLVVPFVMEEQKTKTGLLIPHSITIKDRHKNDLPVARYRYFVVGVADDFALPVEIGDEVYPLIYDGTSTIQLPVINDYNNNMQEFSLLHDSEVMAYRKNTHKLEKEEISDEGKD